MKATLYSLEGKESGKIDLPKLFDIKPRLDIVKKFFEADKFVQPYAAKDRAGMRQSAHGTISHKRHDWKGHYGRGISRLPRKTMYRRGTQFVWVGANVPGTVGGRRAHPPKGVGKEKKINKKEIQLALNSGFAATADDKLISKRYESVEKIKDIPKVIEVLPTKTKPLKELLKKIFKDNEQIVFKNKTVRAGKGKLRGRKYKSNAGVLIIVSKEEDKKLKGFDIRTTDEVTIADLYPLGRITVYTKKALEELK